MGAIRDIFTASILMKYPRMISNNNYNVSTTRMDFCASFSENWNICFI